MGSSESQPVVGIRVTILGHQGYEMTVNDLRNCLERIRKSGKVTEAALDAFADECPILTNYNVSMLTHTVTDYYGKNSWIRSIVKIKDHMKALDPSKPFNLDFRYKVFISDAQMEQLKEFERLSGTCGSTVGIIHANRPNVHVGDLTVNPLANPPANPPVYPKDEPLPTSTHSKAE